MDQIWSAIGQYAFPIVACVVMGWYDIAVPLYEKFIKAVEIELGKEVPTGTFGADMKVELLNDGPVTIIIDSKEANL